MISNSNPRSGENLRTSSDKKVRSSRRHWLRKTALGVAGLGLYTWGVEPHWLQFTHLDLAIRDLPTGLQNATAIQISDIHIGPRVDDSYLRWAFEQVAALKPEFVLYTGDFVNWDEDLFDHGPRMMQSLPRGSLGTLGVLGNHDYGAGWRDEAFADRVASLAREAGVQVLRNEVSTIRGLSFIGIDELWANRMRLEDVATSLEERTPSLVLLHHPDGVDRLGWNGFDGWILSGHTHGGQCKPPFLPPPVTPVQNKLYTSGVFELSGNRTMYINRGLGHLLRVRFNCRPEITVFRLKRRLDAAG